MITGKFRWTLGLAAVAAVLLGGAVPGLAEEAAAPPTLESMMGAFSDVRMGIDTVWVLVAAMLVFWMNAGFALVESGLCQAKNATNILANSTSSALSAG